MKTTCFICGKEGRNFFGYIICDKCKKNLGLFTDETIKRHIYLYKSSKNHTYEKEAKIKLKILEEEYSKKRIKLLHILERIKEIR